MSAKRNLRYMAGFQFNYFKEGIRLTMFFGIDVLAPVRRDTSSTHIMPRQDKAKAVRDTIRGPITPRVPASVLQLHPCCVILTDREAGKLMLEE